VSAGKRIAVLVLWLVLGVLAAGLRPFDDGRGRSRDALSQIEVNRSSLARILGEFRTGTSDLLFIKTERYLHSGVGYMPHLEEDLMTVEGFDRGVEEHLEEVAEDLAGYGEGDFFEHDEVVDTLVPPPESDYRRWLGEMHRTVKPWLDPSRPHRHTDGRELIPWFRLMTLSDPHHIRGYVVGAFWIRQHNLEAALSFLDEGLRHNPDDFQLHLSRGLMLVHKARRLGDGTGMFNEEDPEVMTILQNARESFVRSANEMMRVRPEETDDVDIDDVPGWDRYMESDAMAAANMSVYFERTYGDPDAAAELLHRLQQTMPNYQRLFR